MQPTLFGLFNVPPQILRVAVDSIIFPNSTEAAERAAEGSVLTCSDSDLACDADGHGASGSAFWIRGERAWYKEVRWSGLVLVSCFFQ